MYASFINKIKSLSQTRTGVILFLLTFFLRAIYSGYIYANLTEPESNAYIDIAREILSQEKIFYTPSLQYYNAAAPLLPLIIATTMFLFGSNLFCVYLVTSFASALITLYTYKTACLFLDRKTSVFAGLWSVFYIFYFYYTPTPGKDIWMAFFMIYLIYMIILMFPKGQFSYLKYFIFICMFVLSFHLDERFFVFTPIILIYILTVETKQFSVLSIKKVLFFLFMVILLMLPWTIRNYIEHDKIVLLSTRTEVFTDKIFGYKPRSHFIDKNNDIYGTFYIHDYQIDSIISGTKSITDGGWEINKVQIEAMKNGKIPRPLTGIKALWSRTIALLEPFQLKGRYERTGYFYYKKSLRHNIATFIFYGVLFFFSFPGFYFLYKQDKHVFGILFSVILIYTLIHVLSIPYTNWRYRLPLDSIFIIVGCFGIMKAYSLKHEVNQATQN